MKKSNKRLKVTKESTIADIAASVAGIANTLGSIGKTHSLLLKSNNVIVKYLLSLEEERKKLNYSKIGQTSEAPPAEKSTEKSADETAVSVPA